MGPAGPTGPTGPSGIVGSAFTSGFGAAPTAATAFIGPTVSVVVAANQKVHVVSNKALGTSGAAATGLNLYICYQLGAGAVTTFGGGSLGHALPANTRVLYEMNAVITGLPAGTYNVGLCGLSAAPAPWNSTEWGYTSALIFN